MNDARKELLQDLLEKMLSIIRHVHDNQDFRFGEFTLGQAQVRILFYIAKIREEAAVKDLVKMLGVTPGAVTQLVDGLVEMDLVRREEDASDRRIIRIKLTEFAKGKLKDFKRSYLGAAGQTFDVLSDAEIAELDRLLDKVSTT